LLLQATQRQRSETGRSPYDSELTLPAMTRRSRFFSIPDAHQVELPDSCRWIGVAPFLGLKVGYAACCRHWPRFVELRHPAMKRRSEDCSNAAIDFVHCSIPAI
jgi:hypothetical protein